MSQSAVPRPVIERQSSLAEIPVRNEASSSGISWAAVLGGAFVSASLALILLALGTGLGFSSVSPWSNLGAWASMVGKGAVVWLILTQVLASAMGGYLAGRLRTKWTHVHTDEVYFRDTAHGLLVWAVGMVITASCWCSSAAKYQRHDGDDWGKRWDAQSQCLLCRHLVAFEWIRSNRPQRHCRARRSVTCVCPCPASTNYSTLRQCLSVTSGISTNGTQPDGCREARVRCLRSGSAI